MNELEKKLLEELAERGISIPLEGASALIKRFGVKDVKEIDEDFLSIVLSQLEPEEEVEDQQQEDSQPSYPTAEKHLAGLATAIQIKAETEAAKLSELYANVPNRVKEIVLKDIEEELKTQPKEISLVSLRNVIDFTVVMTTDQTESRRFLYQVLVGIFLLIALFLLGGIYESVNSTSESSTTVNINTTPKTSN